MALSNVRVADSVNRRSFIGGSDARIIMGQDDMSSAA
jgi:predicted phage-related endonuclease